MLFFFNELQDGQAASCPVGYSLSMIHKIAICPFLTH